MWRSAGSLARGWRPLISAGFSSAAPPKRMPGKPPVLPLVARKDIPRLFELKTLQKGLYRAEYHGEPSEMGDNIYGGLLLAQGLQAAQIDVGAEFLPTAFHSFFVSYPFSHLPVDYHVEVLRDGKSFRARSLKGVQKDGEVVFAGIYNFSKKEETTIQHATPMPEVKPPEECDDFFEWCERSLAAAESGKLKLPKPSIENLKRRLFDKPYSVLDIRPLTPEHTFVTKPFKNIPQRYWLKASFPMGDDPAFHRAVLSYLNDMYLVGAVIFPHASQGNLPKVVASLDNSIYFHSYDFRADEWLLYEVHSPAADGGRGVSFGKLWKQDGTLIATTSQEILARFARKSKL